MNLINIVRASLLAGLFIYSSHCYAESSVWKVSKDKKHFYLGGTVHLLSPQDHPLPQEFINAYQDSDKLVFEIDLAALQTPEYQQTFLSAMMYSSDKTLIEGLNKETYSKLKNFLISRNIPIENFAQFQPWAVALTITTLEYQLLGMKPEYGVDAFFHKLALAENKEVGSLETPDEQISFLKSMGKVEPNIMINYTLRDLEMLPEFIKILKDSWRNGDIETFTTNSSIVQMKSEFPELYSTLVTDRNNNWMSDLLRLNSDDTTEFVLVGAMHLNGKEGLLNQLQLAGFKVEQL